MKMTDAKTTNQAASRLLIAPRGNSRFAVLGFKGVETGVGEAVENPSPRFARRPWPEESSRWRSTSRPPRRAASKAPASANGRANTGVAEPDEGEINGQTLEH